MGTDWFEHRFWFAERSYDDVQQKLEVAGATLRSRVDQRTFAIGELRTPSVRDLRDGPCRRWPTSDSTCES